MQESISPTFYEKLFYAYIFAMSAFFLRFQSANFGYLFFNNAGTCLPLFESGVSRLESSVLSNKILYANVLSFFECTNWYCLCCGIFPRSSNVVYQK